MQKRTLRANAWWLFLLLVSACRSADPSNEPRVVTRPPSRLVAASSPSTALPLDRIAIVGASVSAGFGGTPFGTAFTAAAPRSTIEDAANVALFRDPIGDTARQVDRAIAFRATAVVGLDLMFWSLYGSTDPTWRARALESALSQLERARESGAWIILGDVPHVVTASEILIPREAVPSATDVATFNRAIADWGRRDRVLIVPFASWAEPLANDQETELSPGERVPARQLVTPDGLHPNALGVWALLDRLDRYIESKLPGTPKDALVFVRPR